MRWRRVLIVAVCVVAAVAIGVRIWWVNENAYHTPVEKYQMGEWVAYDGCFMDTGLEENNRGYSVRVDGAEVMSMAEYLERYAVNDIYEDEVSERQSLVVVTMSFKNEGNENEEQKPAINLIATNLVTEDNIEFLYPLLDLWGSSEPTVTSLDQVPFMFTISADTEYTIRLPFTMGMDTMMTDWLEIDHDSFYLYVTRGPIQKLIEVTL